MVQLKPGLQEHDGNVQGLAVIVLRQGHQRMEAFEVESSRVIRRQAEREIVDDHGLFRVGNLAEQAASEGVAAGSAVSTG